MSEQPPPAHYWDTQERLGQVDLSPRDTLVVSVVSHSGAQYVRLQVHRSEMVDGIRRSTPGSSPARRARAGPSVAPGRSSRAPTPQYYSGVSLYLFSPSVMTGIRIIWYASAG